MILKAFPDLSWLKKEAEASFISGKNSLGTPLTHKGWPTVVLNVTASHVHRDNIKGPLSLFTNFNGESIVEADKRRVKIKSRYYFITNPGQYYTLDIEKNPTETFNVHFGQHFASQVFQSLVLKLEDILDGDREGGEPGFHNRLYRKSEPVDSLLMQIRSSEGNAMLLEEKLIELMGVLIHENSNDKKLKQRLPVVKKSTREEIMRRMLHATDYLHSQYSEAISIDDVAGISCLSKFHFLRLFKVAYGTTPHQFLNEVRVDHAKVLLKDTNLAITDIAAQTGFKDASSFSRMFYNQVGAYPTQFRQQI
jgi:AraC family transcriptional regulator